jgi:hypothetical protein
VVLDDWRELERRFGLAIESSPRATAIASDLLEEIARMDDAASAGSAPAGEPHGAGGD